MNKKLFAKILIPIITLGIFIAPIGNDFKIKTANAAETFNKNIFQGSNLSGPKNMTSSSATLNIDFKANNADWQSTDIARCSPDMSLGIWNPICTGFKISMNGNLGIVVTEKTTGTLGGFYDFTDDVTKNFSSKYSGSVFNIVDNLNPWGIFQKELEEIKSLTGAKTITGLKPETEYIARMYFRSNDTGVGGVGSLSFLSSSQRYYQFGSDLTFQTPKTGETVGDFTVTADIVTKDLTFGCYLVKLDGSGTVADGLTGCVASLTYMVWGVTSYIAHLAGRLLDFFVYYSTNSAAYTSTFTTSGWKIIRDIANIFFIIALLYIAIKTILNLNVSNNKKLISSIIIVALIINFSLFFTQVIIDSTNILAKVFYNQISSVDENGNKLDPKEGGEKSISVGLVKAFDPQAILSSGKTQAETQKAYDDMKGSFIFITVILIALTLYLAYMFFIVSILFVGRVVSLWIAMIFSPIAFVSYTVPFDIPGFGHKEWWKNLLGNAFMAPIFIFFLYIILLFAEAANEIVYTPVSDTSANGLFIRLMGVIIPFAIIFILIMKSKDLAVKLSGELGATISKIGGVASMAIGGGAVGFAAAAIAKGGKATVGRAGSAMANSSWAKNMASSDNMFKKFIGNKAMTAGQAAGKASFDARGVKIAGKSLASTGLKVGEAKKGGFEQAKADQIAKRQKRAQELKAGPNEKAVKDLRESETDHQELLSKNKSVIEDFDKQLIKAKEDLKEASEKAPGSTEAKKAGFKVENLKEQKAALLNGTKYEGDKTGEIEEVGTGKFETKMVQEFKDVPDGIGGTKKVLVGEKEETTEIMEKRAVRDLSTAKDYRDNGKGAKKDEKGNIIYQKAEKGDFKDKDGYRLDKENGQRMAEMRSIHHIEKEELRVQRQTLETLNKERTTGYAKGMDTFLGKAFSFATTGGEHSGVGADEAAYRIRMDQKLDTGTKV